ncbi:MAG: PAS domain S-box protein [Deltaproteobacteria bacterium]|nr:PAS domain S-box protein [Deltaproteobacteria bacterium]
MHDRVSRGIRGFLAERASMVLPLLRQLTLSVLEGPAKWPERLREAGNGASPAWPFEADGTRRILREGPCCCGSRVTGISEVERDLAEKNEYLRVVNEEVIKLTPSLEATNAELEKTRDHLDSLIQNSAGMIVSTGRRRTITLFNRRAEEVLGYRSGQVVGRPAR